MTTLRNAAKLSVRRMSLLSDPLSPRNIAKSQSKSKFPLPSLVSFDLWGTLFTPKAPIAEQYFQISSTEFGLQKTQAEIAAGFPTAFHTLQQKAPNYGKNSGYASTDEWWSHVICQVYGLSTSDATGKALSRRLIDHFKGSDAYEAHADVVPLLKQLDALNVRYIGSSNSDHRVLSIMESLGLSQYFVKENINLSYDLGYAKPDRLFYRTIAQKYFNGGSMTSFLENAWHIGDSYENDFAAAVRSGWNGVLLDRPKKSVFFKHHRPSAHVTNDCFEGQSNETPEGDNLVMISDNRVCVSGLAELVTLFK